MPEEFDKEDYSQCKTIDDYNKTLEGSKYFHSLYLKAVNHPVRRSILEIIKEFTRISESELVTELKKRNILEDSTTLRYNMDFLLKALCIERISDNEIEYYQITQAGKVVEYLK